MSSGESRTKSPEATVGRKGKQALNRSFCTEKPYRYNSMTVRGFIETEMHAGVVLLSIEGVGVVSIWCLLNDDTSSETEIIANRGRERNQKGGKCTRVDSE